MNAGIFFNFGLQGAGKALIAFVGDNGQYIDGLVLHARAICIHAKAQATAYFLAFFQRALRFIQRANLKHIGIVPAFTQRRMAENELQRLIRRKQPLLVAHDERVGVVIFRGIAARVFPLGARLAASAFFVA